MYNRYIPNGASYAVSTDRTLFGLTEFALPDGTVLHTVEQ